MILDFQTFYEILDNFSKYTNENYNGIQKNNIVYTYPNVCCFHGYAIRHNRNELFATRSHGTSAMQSF